MRTRIRTTVATIAVATSVAGLVAATPSNAKEVKQKPTYTQTQTETYILPAYDVNEEILGQVHVSGGDFKPPIWARYVSVAVTDATGLPTAGDVTWEARYTHALTTIGTFCGRTTQSYRITASSIETLWVDLRQGPCNDGTVAGGSTGTVSVTFTS